MTLNDDHRSYLNEHAVTDEVIEQHGVCSEEDVIVFTWRDGDRVTEQRRQWPGESGQYLWEKDKELHFWNLRDAGPDSPVFLVEGTKQSLAASGYAPEGWSVLGMAGCWGWSKEKLSRFRGRKVVVCLDADAGSNLDVYEAGERLADKLKRYNVTVGFTRFPGTGKEGLDDYLATLDDDERADILAYEIEHAGKNPADRRPTTRKRKMSEELPDTGGRPGVAVNIDRRDVIDQITGHLKAAHDGVTLFNFGEVITRVKGHETQPLDRDRFFAVLADTVFTCNYSEATEKRPAQFAPAWPDSQTIGAVMSKADAFSPLRRVVRVPFMRPDGTVCYTPGYDKVTGTVLILEGLEDVHVPDEPSRDETLQAAKFLLEEWLGDMPFKTPADRANALAMVLTPFMRGLVPLAPLCVVSGLQPGVGKNLFADCVALLSTGQAAEPLPYVKDDEEMRKQITSAFSSGAEIFVFDEAHVIEGPQLARAITSLTYTDRILGASRIAKYPNAVTWMSLGNQVQVNGDLARRVYFIYLHPAGTNVIDREAKEFRHPDLKLWTAENRPALVSAALTVLRGWFSAGKPVHSRGATMGSFEPWDRLMSGVLAYAGLPEFLTDVRARRSESDFSTSYWEAHVHWLHETFGGEQFTTSQVREAAMREPQRFEAPPNMEDASGKDFTRKLGRFYASHADRNYNGVRLIKAGLGHKSIVRWQTVTEGGQGSGPGNPDGGTGGIGRDDSTFVHEKNLLSSSARTRAHARVRAEEETTPPHPSRPSTAPLPYEGSPSQITDTAQYDPEYLPDHPANTPPVAVGFDLEGASASQLFVGGHEGPYVRLAGATFSDQSGLIDADPGFLLSALNSADVVYGHNILGFDLLALARHHGADYDALAAKAVDTVVLARLIDPPGAKGMKPWGQAGYYGLDQVANRLGHAGKTDDLANLANEFGGYDRIPQDDSRYIEYLRGDLAATRHVYEELTSKGLSDYAKREMRVVALQNRMTLNGWKVDTELLAERVAGEAAKIEEAKAKLAGYGMPLAKPDKVKLRTKSEWPLEHRGRSVADIRSDLGAAVRDGLAYVVPGELHKSPWATDAGRDALVRAFQEAGAEHYPRTKPTKEYPQGRLCMSADALGEDFWIDHLGKRRPGMLRVYGHIPAVRELCETLTLATGATAKYAEIQTWTTSEGRVHPRVTSPQASGRWATTEFASSNMGSRGEAGEQRAVLIAEPGHVLLTCDLSQVDMRAMAAMSQDQEYMKLFQPGRDAHMEMAEIYFGERTPEARQKTKAFNHAGNYGQGVKAVSERTGLPLDVCQRIAEAKAEAYPRLAEYISEVRALAETGVLLDNGFGRLMRPDPERAWTQAPALIGQGAARDIMCESLLRLVDLDPTVTEYLRGVVHDEVIVSVPVNEVERWQAALRSAFTWEWKGVPILCEVSNPALRWSDCQH